MVTDKEYKSIAKKCKIIAKGFKIEDDYEDILQNVFISSLNKNVDNVESYITKSFRNRCIDIKRKKQLEYVSVDNIDVLDDKESNYSETAAALIYAIESEPFLNIPAIDKMLFLTYFKEGLSYINTSKKHKIDNSTSINKIKNLIQYICLIKLNKFFTKYNKKMKKVDSVVLKPEYEKYGECVLSARNGYYFNYDLFKDACEVAGIILSKTDKFNKEKLKQAADKLFNLMFVEVKDDIEFVKEEVINDIKEVEDDKPRKGSRKPNKK